MLQNAWFRLDIKEDGLYILFHPPVDGGQELAFAEVNLYLIKNRVNLKQEEKESVKQILESLQEETEVKIRDTGMLPVDESLTVNISGDKLTAVARAYAPSNDGVPLSKEDFLAQLSAAGVRYGIRDGIIDFWLGRRVYCSDFLVAEGTAPEESEDASITYYFNADHEFKPMMDDNGNIDFHQLNLIDHVAAGDILAMLTPEYEGKPGTNVLGVGIPSRKPTKATLAAGPNTELSTDGSVLTATSTGHVEVLRGKVSVNNVYTIKGNVGAGTGDIEYDGSVRVNGDVLAGYSVKATGDIYVGGAVEAAYLEAGGQVVLNNGMHGDAKGSLKAGGDITAKFIQACNVEAGGSVASGSILHCHIAVRDSIVVVSKRGVISGGEYMAGKLIQAVTVGSPAKTNTQLEIKPDETLLEEYQQVEAYLVEKRLEQRKARQSYDIAHKRLSGVDPLPPDKAAFLETLLGQISAMEADIHEKMARYDSLKAALENYDQGRIVVKGDIYEGTRVIISGVSLYIRNRAGMCQFLLDGGEIKSASL